MNKEIILLIKYLTSIYLLSFVFFTVIQKIHNRLYYSRRKNIYNRCSKDGNASSIQKLNKNKYKKRLTKEERRRIKQKYKLEF